MVKVVNPNRVYITGGAGCLGVSIAQRLISLEVDLFIIDNYETGIRDNIPTSANVTILDGDIRNADIVSKSVRDFDPEIVIHAAASYNDPNNPQKDLSTNVGGMLNLIDAVEKSNVRRFINFQTALCYGRPKSVPIHRDDPTSPFTSYGITKTAAEQFLLSSGIPAISLRLANICGPGLAIGPIPTFYKRIKEGKDCFCTDSVRDFLESEDFLALCELIIAGKGRNGIYNVSTGKGSSIKEVYEAVCMELGVDKADVSVVPVQDDDVQEVVLDSEETYQDFSWKPRFGFREIISRQVDWYNRNGIGKINSHLKYSEWSD